MKISAAIILILGFTSLTILTGFTCSKHVPVNEQPVPQESMTSETALPSPIEEAPAVSTDESAADEVIDQK